MAKKKRTIRSKPKSKPKASSRRTAASIKKAGMFKTPKKGSGMFDYMTSQKQYEDDYFG